MFSDILASSTPQNDEPSDSASHSSSTNPPHNVEPSGEQSDSASDSAASHPTQNDGPSESDSDSNSPSSHDEHLNVNRPLSSYFVEKAITTKRKIGEEDVNSEIVINYAFFLRYYHISLRNQRKRELFTIIYY